MSVSTAASCQQNPSLSHTLESLYVVNKHAKQCGRNANSSHQFFVTKHNTEANQKRKTALYQVKKRILEQISMNATHIELHQINGEDYYCLYFGSEWSFHTPADEFSSDLPVDGHLYLPDFKSGSSNVKCKTELTDALMHLKREFGVNANDYLPSRHLTSPCGSYIDIGWAEIDG